MRIKRRIDILTLSITAVLAAVLVAALLSGRRLQDRTAELQRASKELEILSTLETALSSLGYSLSGYISEPDPTSEERVRKDLDRLFKVIGRTWGVRLDVDEHAMITYLRERASGFTEDVNRILLTKDQETRKRLYGSLRRELFDKISGDIESHRAEDVEKLERAEKEVEAARQSVTFLFPAAFSLLLLGMILMRAVINKTVITPLVDVSNMSRLMASGNLDREITVSSGDELQELARSFNQLACSLREKISGLEEAVQKEQAVVRELAILNEFIGYVSSELKFETLLQRFIERTRDLMKAENAAIILFQNDDKDCFCSTSSRIDEKVVEEVLTGGSGEIAEIVAGQGPLRRNEISYPVSEDWSINNLIALPLQTSTDLRCLLVVFNRQGGFSQDEEDSLFNFAFQAFQTISIQNELARMATTDGLTTLYNHRVFQDRLTEEIERAERYKRRLYLLMIDIDHFKGFNDTYGHQTGDDVLKAIAKIIKGNTRKVDFPARYGGEEFAVILPETEEEDARRVAERLRRAVVDYPFYLNDGTRVNLTVSIGGACFPDDATEKEALISKADTALYHAKNGGRNRVSLYSEVAQREEL